ncbi:MAG TPA: cytochrome P450 [Dehalococcoidia bacterium]|nr:cytochrome P450 [Dehalococcoidia bacterium]
MTTDQQPASTEFLGGFFDNPQINENPFPFFAGLRQTSPVMRMGEANFWIVTKYDDVVRILRDHETFSSMVDAASMRGEARPPTILFDDPPIHTRVRGIISKAFTPRTLEAQRPEIERLARGLIDKMLAKDSADYVAELSYPLPVMVIARMLGVEEGNMADFKRWSDAIIQNIGTALFQDDGLDAIAHIREEFDAYFRMQIERLRAEPRDNLLSALIQARGDDGTDKLSEEDLLMVCRVLLVAGNETTTGLIVNCARVLAERPDVLARLREDIELVPSFIEETLRYYPPFFATFRRTKRDAEVRGVTIPKDHRVLVLLASANRDEDQFPDAAEFVVDREPNRHVGFGMGIHYCVGAPLARMETEIAMRLLIPRITSLTIERAEDDSVLRPGGPESLHVRFQRDLAAAPA